MSSIEISVSCLVVGEIPTYKRLAILYLSCPQLWDRVAVEHGLQGQNMTACLSTFSKSWTEEWITEKRQLQDHLRTKQYGRIMNYSKLHILVSSKQHEINEILQSGNTQQYYIVRGMAAAVNVPPEPAQCSWTPHT